MGFLDIQSERYPKTWREMSYDYKLAFLYHGSMMVLFVAGQLLSVAAEVMIATTLLAATIILGIRHRRTTPWVWPEVSIPRLLGAFTTVVLGSLFLFAATPLFPPTNPGSLPWYLAGLGIIVFGTLHTLKLVAFAEDDYFTPPPIHRPVEIPWKKVVRLVYSILFLAVWLDGVASFYCFGTAFRAGSAVPTIVQTEPLRDHGRVVYVTASQKHLVDMLQTGMAIGMPSALILGALLHFIVGIELIPNAPTLGEWRRRRKSGGR